MRLMLGDNDRPSLLVEIEGSLSDKFHFWVVNGCWNGYYNNGYVTIENEFTSLEKCNILCTNQDRLRGDYNTVFNNFHDENYVGPKWEVEHDFDDGIPF